MKYEWRKEEKELYLPKKQPVFIDVPKFGYLTIEGEGDPNKTDFQELVATLYAAAYTIRMLPKKGFTPDGYFEYTVYPLEGEWTTKQRDSGPLDKSLFAYKIMIRQPEFVTQALFEEIKPLFEKKLPIDQLRKLKLEELTEGPSIQMLHLGSYDSEPASFAQMEQFAAEQGLERVSKDHKEIYLSDPRRTAPENLKTVLRFAVKQKL
ncbi:GyrI-like domain-containing protein [Listeria kieliensis]|uniref:GyrI-like small molecule binding domain-containing protein n=1 Tax=Listeria kieliensis TaxID=1621700 RepID=A0A3D8TUT2_9LIST|nr:GyrI-like domain-containing protein [Listeria kieliensis]RDX02549.1 hypothetical protein UR08_03270 [Listeria kieliensis]